MTTDRDAYIRGIRRYLALCEANPDVPLPYSGASVSELLFIHDTNVDRARATINAIIREADEPALIEIDPNPNEYFQWTANVQIDGYKARIYATRAVGQETVDTTDWLETAGVR